MIVFKIVYWAGMIMQVVIRAPFAISSRAAGISDRRVSLIENILLAFMTVVALVLPMIYSVTSWLSFANYNLPAWLGWSGVFLLACSLFIFTWAHIDLKSNWSSSLEIHQEHTLITNGIYGTIRHPMYASQLLWVIVQILLIQNWLAGPLDLVFFVPFYFLRSHAEEKMMLDTFGDQYRQYMHKVGGLIPK